MKREVNIQINFYSSDEKFIEQVNQAMLVLSQSFLETYLFQATEEIKKLTLCSIMIFSRLRSYLHYYELETKEAKKDLKVRVAVSIELLKDHCNLLSEKRTKEDHIENVRDVIAGEIKACEFFPLHGTDDLLDKKTKETSGAQS